MKGQDPLEEEKGGNKTEFNLEIYNNSRIKMDFERKTKDDFFGLKSYCAPKENPLVNPETWKITNEDKDLEGKHLLVFHLLPQSATQWYKGDNIERNLNRTRPKCDLFIRFVIFFYFSKNTTNFYLSEKASLRISSSRSSNNDYKHNYNNHFETGYHINTYQNNFNVTTAARNYNKCAGSKGHQKGK